MCSRLPNASAKSGAPLDHKTTPGNPDLAPSFGALMPM
jgi:hypothetical protein